MRTFKDYQNEARRTARKDMSPKQRLVVAGLGITGEAGEVADLIKKHVGHDHDLQEEELKKELGDVLWYISEICEILKIDISSVAEKNIAKLKNRYPNGFEAERSINR